MWQQLVKTFFIGQVACEQAVEAMKKQRQSLSDKHEGENTEELEHKAEESKSEKLLCKLEDQFKTNVAGLRKGFRSFDQACLSLSQLLVETAELKETLASKEASEKELVNA